MCRARRRYLREYTSDASVFPLFRECMLPENCSADSRILLVASKYSQIMRGGSEAGD